MPTVKALLQEARLILNEADVDTPSLDARLLLQMASGLAPETIVASPDAELSDETTMQFRGLIKRRANHEPVSRILGLREFYGREFVVTPDVLDPRGDTETLIDLALSLLPLEQPHRILDLGTGSGIIALTLLAERPLATATAIDVSEHALVVARGNALRLCVGSRCDFYQGHWFTPITGKFDLILSNPPYIETTAIAGLSVDVKDHDPHLALDGGADGLFAYRDIASGASQHLSVAGHVVVEIGAGQHTDVAKIFTQSGFILEQQKKDLGGHIRCLAFSLPSQA